ncbi:MAG TPA: septum formation initiator family protein [candidate division WOR-3 bacterium]|uniref:Septum formation initiator family protein n=1 Tax=candidate division WOR-3 bacterium TaxID=2052148 RepID=A0A7C0XBV1_UNCW3|nr:septum formation initiator family protein [candidate division WOR-3 bacterium]
MILRPFGARNRRSLLKWLFVPVIIWIVYQSLTGFWTIYRLRKERNRLEREIAELTARKIVLERQKEMLKDPEKIEEIARKRLGMRRKGERIIWLGDN